MNAVFVTRTKLFAARPALQAWTARLAWPGWPAWLIVAGTLIRIPQLWHGLNEQHSFRQTQTAYVALEFARHGINPLRTPLPVFGPHADVPMDFPLVQALAAVLIRLGATADWAVRTVGLVGFQAAAILLAVLVSRWHGRAAMLVVLALFEFSPFGLAWGAAALIEFPAVALALGMVVGLDSWFRTGSHVGLLTGVGSGWLAFLVKATTPPPGVCSYWSRLQRRSRPRGLGSAASSGCSRDPRSTWRSGSPGRTPPTSSKTGTR